MIIDLNNAQGLQHLWKQERIIVRSNLYPTYFWTDLHGTHSEPIAVYNAVGNYRDIDITDYVRTYPNVTALYFADGGAEDDYRVTIPVQVDGLINPSNVLIPAHPTSALIIPPSIIYLPNELELADQLIVEIYGEGEFDVTGRASLMQGERGIAQIDGNFSIVYDGESRLYTPRAIPCGKFALVRWVSFSGQLRCAVMPIIKHNISTSDAYSLSLMSNEFNAIKGRVDEIVFRLDMLSAYDLWYYADVITSSRVEVSLDGEEYTRVEVTDSGTTIPDGETRQDGRLEIKVNYKKYDAVAM